MTPEELEAWVSRSVAQLPRPQAPNSLLPGILAEIQRREIQARAAGSRSVPVWLAVPGWIAVVAAVAWIVNSAPAGEGIAVVNALSNTLSQLWRAFIGNPLGPASTAAPAGTVSLLWRAFIEPILQPLAYLVGAMSVLSVLYLTALSYAFKGNEVSREE